MQHHQSHPKLPMMNLPVLNHMLTSRLFSDIPSKSFSIGDEDCCQLDPHTGKEKVPFFGLFY